MQNNSPTKVIIDTDPGVDDALAILLALASPELDVVGITTVCGNVPVGQGTKICSVCCIFSTLPRDYWWDRERRGRWKKALKRLFTCTGVTGWGNWIPC